MKIWCISDSHGLHSKLSPPENVDAVIFSGDAGTSKDPYRNAYNVLNFIEWFESLDIKHKIWIAGNHDTSIEAGIVNAKGLSKSSVYLEHELTNIEGINIFGSPYTPEFYNWAFNLNDRQLLEYWENVPTNTDILITHGPPWMIMDECSNKTYTPGKHVGCKYLLNKLGGINPKLHIYGHIHENTGVEKIGNTTFVNCAVVDDDYKIVNNGIIIEI